MKVLYVLPVKGGGGGAHSVAQEVNEMIRFGVDARIAVNSSNAPSFMTNYADLPNICGAIDVYSDIEQLAAHMAHKDVVVCTIFTSVEIVGEALKKVEGRPPRVAYYVQDYEPMFCEPGSELREQAVRSYTHLSHSTLFAKTDWIRDIVTRNHGVSVEKVSPSLDTSLYYPSTVRNDSAIWVTAMIRPKTRRRAPRRTMSVLKELHETYGSAVNINIFGCGDADIVENQLSSDFQFTNHGVLSRRQVASLFRASEVVMDLSDYQAFGRTGLEAMACSCITFLPVFGGSHEYAVDGVNSLLVDTRSKGKILERFEYFMNIDSDRRKEMRKNAVTTSQRYSISAAAWSEIDLFERIVAA